jgi:hypothetical protein
MGDLPWQRAWAALRRVFLALTPEDQREVEFYAAYLLHKRKQHARQIRLEEEDPEAHA